MRLLVSLLVMVLFAGCVAEEEKPDNPLFDVCPQWMEGPAVSGNATLEQHGSLLLAPRAENGSLVASHHGFPLDLYVLDVETANPVTIRVQTELGRSLLVRDALAKEPDSRPSLVVDGQATVSVYLTAIQHGTAPDPSAIVLMMEGSGEVQVTGSAWYRVCGAVLEKAD